VINGINYLISLLAFGVTCVHVFLKVPMATEDLVVISWIDNTGELIIATFLLLKIIYLFQLLIK
jgi:hypothetical protein